MHVLRYSKRTWARSSAPAKGVVNSVQNLVEQGYFEVVLAGIHLGTYQHGDDNLENVVQQVLDDSVWVDTHKLYRAYGLPIELAEIAKRNPQLYLIFTCHYNLVMIGS